MVKLLNKNYPLNWSCNRSGIFFIKQTKYTKTCSRGIWQAGGSWCFPLEDICVVFALVDEEMCVLHQTYRWHWDVCLSFYSCK